MKTDKNTYFVPISFGPGGVYGSGATPEVAAKNALREARSFGSAMGGFKAGATLSLRAYIIPAGCYAYFDSVLTYVVDHDTDKILTYALIVKGWDKVPTNATGPWDDLIVDDDVIYPNGIDKLVEASKAGAPPIGSTVIA